MPDLMIYPRLTFWSSIVTIINPEPMKDFGAGKGHTKTETTNQTIISI